MPRLLPTPNLGSRGRVQRALYFRCRRGEPEALAALLYSLVDRLYTAASYLLPDETTAVTTVAEVWHELLDLLQAPRVGGHLPQRAYALLARKLAPAAEPAAVARALKRARDEAEDGLVPYPSGDLQVLLDAVPRHAEQIAALSQRRERRLRQGWLALAGLGVVLLAYGGWWWQESRALAFTGVQLECLQERVTKQDLAAAVRECSEELMDPEGADRYEATVLWKVGLVLEELGNAQAGVNDQALGFLAQRVRQENMVDELTELVHGRPGFERPELIQAGLVLEEVANL